ncbi:MAG: flagellar biosynthesis protein FlhF [Oleiphilaceae bacterium]|nr:flagellar biosynthesis protein FlhF [Oleiphilaceae bacterium]
MKVQRFFAKNMAEALRQVREEFGPDAVILSNTKVDGGMELVAALDYQEDAPVEELKEDLSRQGQPSPSQIARMHAEKHLKLQREMDRARQRIEEVRRKRSQEGERLSREAIEKPTMSAAQSPLKMAAVQPELNAPRSDRSSGGWEELSDMKAEILELKNMISEQVTQKRPVAEQKSMLSVVQEQVDKMLGSLCLAESLRKRLKRECAMASSFDEAWSTIRDSICASVQHEGGEIIDRQGVIALVGPTGSGKTMTIGKMAARHVMKYGAEGLALVTTDRYRIAAHEQLKVFGRILNVPVHVVDERNDLESILRGLKHKKLVLIDTAGLQHNDTCWSEQLQEIRMSGQEVNAYLVVPAVGQYQVMCSTYQHYRIMGLSGVIVTKLDEAVSLGEIISFLSETELRAAYYTDGQRVPEDIHQVRAAALLDKAEALLNSSERWVTIRSDEANDNDSFYFHTA